MKIFQLIALCFLTSCAVIPASPTYDADGQSLRKIILPQVQFAVDKLYADEYAAALSAFDLLVAGDPTELTPYELATVLELRATAKMNLEDFDGAKADLEAAYALNALPLDRQAKLREYIDRDFREQRDRVLQPLVRIPPRFPEECIITADQSETETGELLGTVELEFDITSDGVPENIIVTNSTNECLNQSAIESVRRWKYSAPVKDGRAIPVKNQKVVIQYGL